MELISFKTTREGVRCGQQFSLIAKVRLNSFGDADNLYCAVSGDSVGVGVSVCGGKMRVWLSDRGGTRICPSGREQE